MTVKAELPKKNSDLRNSSSKPEDIANRSTIALDELVNSFHFGNDISLAVPTSEVLQQSRTIDNQSSSRDSAALLRTTHDPSPLDSILGSLFIDISNEASTESPTAPTVSVKSSDPVKAVNGTVEGLDPLREDLLLLPEPIRSKIRAKINDIKKYMAHGLFTAALEECLRVIQIAPQYLEIHVTIGEIYIQKGDTKQAIKELTALADVYLVNRRIDDAIGIFQRLLHIDPDNQVYDMCLKDLFELKGHQNPK